jgi:N-acetyl-gamma-glutamyl-phosphate reductase
MQHCTGSPCAALSCTISRWTPMSEAKIPIAVVGASGYAGQVMHALLMHHPRMRPVIVDPRDLAERTTEIAYGCEAAALALPDDAALAWTDALRERGVRVLDLSSAHRLAPGFHYGLPELFGAPPSSAMVVSSPGCYPTATLLALLPLVRAQVIEPGAIAVLGCSGTSGAGKALREDLHFSELHDNCFPYQVGTHKHIGEIEHHLGREVAFVTQLLPIVRGLVVTAFVRTEHEPAQLHATLASHYAEHPWVTVLEAPGQGLGVRHVVGTHQAVLAVGPRAHGGLVPVFASIDNLMRGAASQALHTLNLWLGLPAALGLPAPLAVPPSGVPGMTRALA